MWALDFLWHVCQWSFNWNFTVPKKSPDQLAIYINIFYYNLWFKHSNIHNMRDTKKRRNIWWIWEELKKMQLCSQSVSLCSHIIIKKTQQQLYRVLGIQNTHGCLSYVYRASKYFHHINYWIENFGSLILLFFGKLLVIKH